MTLPFGNPLLLLFARRGHYRPGKGNAESRLDEPQRKRGAWPLADEARRSG